MIKRVVATVILTFLFLFVFVLGIKDHLKAKELAWNLFGKKEEPKKDIINTLPKNIPQYVGIYIITTDGYIRLDEYNNSHGFTTACTDRASYMRRKDSLLGEGLFYENRQIYQVPVKKFKGFLVVSKKYQNPASIFVRVISPTCVKLTFSTNSTKFWCKIGSVIVGSKLVRIEPYIFAELFNEEEKNQILTKNKCSLDSEHCYLIVEKEINGPYCPGKVFDTSNLLFENEVFYWLIDLTKSE